MKYHRTFAHGEVVALICPKHGYIKNKYCYICEEDKAQKVNIGFIDHIDPEWCHGWYEHIDTEPIYIESKKQLIEECGKRGLYPKAFMGRKSQGRGIVVK